MSYFFAWHHAISFQNEASDILNLFEVFIVNTGLLTVVVFVVSEVGSLSHI